MNTLTLGQTRRKGTVDPFPDSFDERIDLTEQEIATGLKILQNALQRKSLPLVLLVEDDDTEAFLFKAALKAVGVAVEFMHFRDGHQALDFFHGRGNFSDRERFPLPALTVLDLKLVRCSGLQILEAIRSRPQLEKLPVVALTSSDDIDELETARRLRINDWISKPRSLPGLVTIVRQILQTWLSPAL